MKSTLRFAAALLACLTVLPAFASCSEQTADTPDTAPVTEAETAAEGENARLNVKDSLPETLNYEGKDFNIYVGLRSSNERFYAGPEEETGDPIDDAVVERNLLVAERLNINLKQTGFEETWDTIPNSISKIVLSNDAAYDFFMGQQAGVCTLITEDLFVNAFDVDHLDFDQPWWNDNYMSELSVGNAYRYFLMGDYNMDAMRLTRSVFFNKTLYADQKGDADQMYQEVLDGKWTIDRMIELSREFSVDLNSNNQTDADDQLGFSSVGTTSCVDALVYGTDIAFTQRDENGFISLSMMSDDAVTLAEKINQLFYQDGTIFSTPNDTENQKLFMSGRLLFLGNASLGAALSLRDMQDAFGYLPYPKFDEEQTGYRSLVHDTVLLGVIPVSAADPSMTGAVLEALNAESYRRVVPAYYENGLKIKYSRDMISTQMIDLIHDSVTTNFIYAYNYALNGIGNMYRELVAQHSSNVASTVKRLEKPANKKLEKILDAFIG